MSQNNFREMAQISVALWGVVALGLVFIPSSIPSPLSRGHYKPSLVVLAFFRALGLVNVSGAIYLLFVSPWLHL
jgi:hypothetical protein